MPLPRLALRHVPQALRQPPFRWWLIERMVGAETWAMRSVARGWLVYELTGSVLALAWVEAVRALVGILVSPLAGVICDRVEKRLVMLAARLLLVGTNLLLAALIFMGDLALWHIVAITLLEATVYSIMEPALQMLIPELVGRERLLSATSITFVVEGVLNIAGAAAAGIIIAAAGAGWVFLGNAPAFALAALALARIPKSTTVSRGAGTLVGDAVAGLRYLRASPIMLIVLSLAFARLLFTQPYSAFLAAFAEGLGFDAAGLGLLTSAAGLGALASSLAIAARGNLRRKGSLLLGSGAAAAAAVTALMMSGQYASPFMFVVLAGFFATSLTVVQSDAIRSKMP